MSAIVRVALPVPLPHLFDYLPALRGGVVTPGSRVLVALGRSRKVGLVIALADASPVPAVRLKPVIAVLDDGPLLDLELLASVGWAADYWLGAPGEAFLGALPVTLRGAGALPPPARDWSLTAAGREALAAGTRRGRSAALLAALRDAPADAATLDVLVPGWRPVARRLLPAELLARAPHVDAARTPSAAPPLVAEQRAAVDTIGARMGGFGAFLLDGVTGSGKTEVYLALIERALAAGRQSLLLVPEIGLAPQTLRRLSKRLGIAVDVLHSNLAAGDRTRAWLRARSGQARVIIGTRSAIFTPLPRAGLIIVDEEHDTSYKQQDGFRYHARDLAVVRARALGVPVVLGSATPSLESLANAAAGRYRHLHLRRRPGTRKAPAVRVLDIHGLRLEHGLSPALLEALDDCVARGEQALVFRNRRGYAPVLLCHACSWRAACDQCDRPLTVHAARGRLICHHCGHQQRLPQACPACGYTELARHGFGTERLDEALHTRYPEVPVIRVDSETTHRRDAFEKLLAPLDAGGPAILVGTQMLAKGHDLPGLTLVAVTSVDESLFSVDYHAGERLAQLIVQVAGRAGRADKPGQVIVQTHYPQHPLLQTLLRDGYHAAARALLDERRSSDLPPFAHQALLRAQAPRMNTVDAFLATAATALAPSDALRVRGPFPAPMPRRAGQYRGQLLLEADQRPALRAVLTPWNTWLHAQRRARGLRWSLDVDPVDLY